MRWNEDMLTKSEGEIPVEADLAEVEKVEEMLMLSPGKTRNEWQLFTSHGLVLISILNNPGKTVREIGLELNLTDRAVAQAITDLEASGYLKRERIGRRTFYHVNEDHTLHYPVSPYGMAEPPQLTVQSLRAENLATHAESREAFIQRLQNARSKAQPEQ